jgi:endonuclease YncB( thermonuclease family)
MAKAVSKLGVLTVGQGALGARGSGRGSVRQQVHDGDTVIIDPLGNLSVRFLGVDAPEESFSLPEEAVRAPDRRADDSAFVPIKDPRWAAFLDDPFAARWPKFTPALSRGLHTHLKARVGTGAAANHAKLADAARNALIALVDQDMQELGQDKSSFRFFLAFASEVMDGYGRLLGYLNRNQPKPPRPRSYNERLLVTGAVGPYFIWPNLDPFRTQPRLVDAVPKPGSSRPRGVSAAAAQPLDDARESIRTARAQQLGVWAPAPDGLRLEPFELRFLARRQPPDRWVIDLSAGDDRLLAPQLYRKIANPEDRLFVPAEYVPLFVDRGWRRVNR